VKREILVIDRLCRGAVLFTRLLQEVRANGTGLEFWTWFSSTMVDTYVEASMKYPTRLFKNVRQVFRPA